MEALKQNAETATVKSQTTETATHGRRLVAATATLFRVLLADSILSRVGLLGHISPTRPNVTHLRKKAIHYI